MHICKICNTKFKRILGHIIKKHANLKVGLLEYLSFYYNFDIIKNYLDGLSAQQISHEISKITDGAINPNKKDILKILKDKNIAIRSTSEAIVSWTKIRGGAWNKNLTKEEHPSIKKYAESRKGHNNVYYTGTEESRKKTRYWEYLAAEELQNIRAKSGETLKKLYKSGEIIHKSKLDPEWAEDCKKKRIDGYKKWLEQNDVIFHGAESKLEKQIARGLEQENIRYKKQLKLKKDKYCYFYDYLLVDYNIIIEYNGTYWHCDPRKYDKEYYNVSKKMYASQIWERDLDKKMLAERNGYDMIVLWEEDYRSLTNEEFLEKTIETIKNKINQKIKN